VGPSGAGKSTFLRLVLGQEAPSRGRIYLDGEPLHPEPGPDRGVVFQRYSVFPHMTVLKNVMFGVQCNGRKRSARDEAAEMLRQVGLGDNLDVYPSALSGGMQQRLAIAQALITHPRILLLDEPFGALDALTRAYLQQELHRIWQAEGITMILVTHDVEEAIYLGDKVVVMEPRPGRIRRIVPVDLAHPRERAALGFAEVKQQVLREFSGDSASLAEPPLRSDAVEPQKPRQWQFAI